MVDVTSVCKNCGQKKPAKNFVMSLEAGKMVCVECAKALKAVKKPAIKNEYKTSFIGKPVVKASTPIARKPSYTPAKSVVFSTKHSSPPTRPVAKPSKPIDYDEEDREIERLSRKKASAPSSHETYSCPSCGYVFKNAPSIGKVYHKCPFCKGNIV